LALVVIATLVREPLTLVACCALCALMAALSHIPLRRFAAVLLAVPLFTAVVALPATLNVVSGGTSLLTLWPWHQLGPWHLAHGLA